MPFQVPEDISEELCRRPTSFEMALLFPPFFQPQKSLSEVVQRLWQRNMWKDGSQNNLWQRALPLLAAIATICFVFRSNAAEAKIGTIIFRHFVNQLKQAGLLFKMQMCSALQWSEVLINLVDKLTGHVLLRYLASQHLGGEFLDDRYVAGFRRSACVSSTNLAFRMAARHGSVIKCIGEKQISGFALLALHHLQRAEENMAQNLAREGGTASNISYYQRSYCQNRYWEETIPHSSVNACGGIQWYPVMQAMADFEETLFQPASWTAIASQNKSGLVSKCCHSTISLQGLKNDFWP